MDSKMPNASELAVQLARECEYQRIEIMLLKARIAELERQLAEAELADKG